MHSDPEQNALRDILRQIDLAQNFAQGQHRDAFSADIMRVYAVTRCLEIISEASRRISEGLKARHPGIAWREMAGAGNVYRHICSAASRMGHRSVRSAGIARRDRAGARALGCQRPGRARDPVPSNPMLNMRPNALIYGARYDRMMEAPGLRRGRPPAARASLSRDPNLRGTLDEAMNHRGPALVNVVISQGAARKPQAFRWHS
jgi:uncharacterized protein with HEPN domain